MHMHSQHKHMHKHCADMFFYGTLKLQYSQVPLVGSTSNRLFILHPSSLFFLLSFDSLLSSSDIFFFICSLFFHFSCFVSLTDVTVFSSLLLVLFWNHFYDFTYDFTLFFTYIWPKSDICSISFGRLTDSRDAASKLFTLAVRQRHTHKTITAVFLSDLPTQHHVSSVYCCQSLPLLLSMFPTQPSSSHMHTQHDISRVKNTNPTLSESHCDLNYQKWLLCSFIYENVSHTSLSGFPSISFSLSVLILCLHSFITAWTWLEIILMCFTCEAFLFLSGQNLIFIAGCVFSYREVYEDVVSRFQVLWSPSGAWC